MIAVPAGEILKAIFDVPIKNMRLVTNVTGRTRHLLILAIAIERPPMIAMKLYRVDFPEKTSRFRYVLVV